MRKLRSQAQANPFTQPSPNCIPEHYFIKYQPPIIGMTYRRHPKEKKKKAYIILLNTLVDLMDSEEITRQLYIEHPVLLPKHQPQIIELVEKLLQNIPQIDVNQVQQQYDQMINDGYSHEQIVEHFKGFGIEIEPHEEQPVEFEDQQIDVEEFLPMQNQSIQQGRSRRSKIDELRDMSKQRKFD